MSNDNSKEDAVKLAEHDAEVISNGIDDIGDLIADGDFDTSVKVICKQANAIKFNASLNKAGRKRAMLNLRNILSNVQATARAMKEDAGLRQEFKTAWSLCYDASR
tara:strand:+ start:750 stop:1067 length:318 start_codon:yes stop_codon:yes gene_type:complete